MNRILSSILCFFIAFSAIAQHAIGDWISFSAFTNISNLEESKEMVYYVSGGYLFSYNKDDNSVSSFSKVEGLSDFDIAKIHYNSFTDQLVIVYSNMNIDLIRGNKLYNISDIKDKVISGDKTSYHYSDSDNLFLISTGFGLVVIDLERREVKDSYNWGIKINCAAINNNNIYISNDNFGIKIGNMKDNLLDFSIWKDLNKEFTPKDFISVGSNLYCLKSNKDVCVLNNSGSWVKLFNNNSLSAFKKAPENSLFAFGNNTSVLYKIKSDNSYNKISLAENIYDISSFSNSAVIWCANVTSNLSSYRVDDTNLTLELSGIGYNGLGTNYPYHLNYKNGYLYVSGGGKSTDRSGNDGMVSIYDGNGWLNTNTTEISDAAGISFRDVVHTTVNPNDPSHIYCFTWGEGVYEIKNNQFVNLYNHTNSGIESIYENNPRYLRVDGGAFDKHGNLWFTNSFVSAPLKVLPQNGTWNNLVNFEYEDLKGQHSLGKVYISSKNYKWINVLHTKKTYGYFVMDNSGSVTNPTGYKTKFISDITYSDGGSAVSVSISTVKGWAEDLDGRIWIGTDKGPFVVNNEANIFRDNAIAFSRVKIPRNDGSELADFLLENEEIVSIAVDGGNRKWFGTSSNGAFLVSSDATEEIHHFTTENSPLPSNNIIQIAINDDSGTVYFGTDKGLVAYQSDASSGKEDYSDVYAFPNPVRPEYNGVITVTGLKENSLVKITDVNNNLIYQTSSLGGMAGWNGLNSKGERVSTGIYFVYGTSEDGKSGVVTKILFVK